MTGLRSCGCYLGNKYILSSHPARRKPSAMAKKKLTEVNKAAAKAAKKAKAAQKVERKEKKKVGKKDDDEEDLETILENVGLH